MVSSGNATFIVSLTYAALLLHGAPLAHEYRAVYNTPRVISQARDSQALIAQFISDGDLTRDETGRLHQTLYNASRSHLTEDFLGLTTSEAARIREGLSSLLTQQRLQDGGSRRITDADGDWRWVDVEPRALDIDWAQRLSNRYEDLITYLQTEDHKDMVRPLSFRERVDATLEHFF